MEEATLAVVVGALAVLVTMLVLLLSRPATADGAASSKKQKPAPAKSLRVESSRWLAEAFTSSLFVAGGLPHHLLNQDKDGNPLLLTGLSKLDGAARPWLHRSASRAAAELEMKHQLLHDTSPHKDTVYRVRLGGVRVQVRVHAKYDGGANAYARVAD